MFKTHEGASYFGGGSMIGETLGKRGPHAYDWDQNQDRQSSLRYKEGLYSDIEAATILSQKTCNRAKSVGSF